MTEIRYVVKAVVAKEATSVGVKQYEPIYLQYTREAGGWYQWSTFYFGFSPFFFKTKEGATEAALGCKGPWYLEPSKSSIKVLSGKYTPAQPEKFEEDKC